MNGDSIDVRLAYGTTGLDVSLPADRTTVVAPRHREAAADPNATVIDALRRPVAGAPLRALARRGQRVAISVCDVTRAQPRELMLRAILDDLDGIIRPCDITVLVATGTHRENTLDELVAMLGAEVVRDCRVVNHVSTDRASLADLGRMDDVPVLINQAWVDADLRITTGFVEPHFFAGFSGGPKMIAPGLAGLDTVLALHNAQRIADPRATWGICEGNPVHDAIRAVAAMAPAQFSVDVLLNQRQAVTRAFGGPTSAMHAAARATAREEAMRPVDGRFDVVVTTNSGYPLDQNLYQSVKGMSAAAEIVTDGGVIVCAAACQDGLPDHSAYAQILASGSSPGELASLIESAPSVTPDQWQVQIQARIQQRARVLLRTDGLRREQVHAAHLEWIDDIAAAVRSAIAGHPDARICVLPEGPQTIPYVA